MNKRQKILLGTILLAPKQPSKIELMKWMFLVSNDLEVKKPFFYDFIPYDYGPFSFTLYNDLNELMRFGYLYEAKLSVHEQLVDNVRREFNTLPKEIQKSVSRILTKYSSLSQSALLDHVYSEYPWFASRSKRLKETSKTSGLNGRYIYTIGYEGISVDLFMKRLLKQGIKHLIDVRNNPVSRKYGFSGKKLYEICEKLDIKYFHFPDVGIPPKERAILKTESDYKNLLFRYEKSILPETKMIQKEIGKLILDKPSALVCFESDYKFCHRSKLADSISKLIRKKVVHI